MRRNRRIAVALVIAVALSWAGAVQAQMVPAGAKDGEARYDIKLRQLEERVVGLKEAVFKAKTSLMLLQEQILQNVIAEAKAVIVHHDDMGSTFTLERVAYYLDTNRIYVQDNRGGQLEQNEEFEIFSGNLVPGNHLLTVEMDYRGNGTLFSYLDGYKFSLKANHTFFAAKGRVIKITAVGYQKGDITMDLKDRPSIKFQTQQSQYTKTLAIPSGGAAGSESEGDEGR